ncbi:MAG: cell division protein [Gammaproteobacteria bacterium]|nr:MAG: cell division protein [Gammaproteobacteria bacterium]
MKRFVSPYGATTRRNVVLTVLLVFATAVFARVMYLQLYHADFLVKQGNSRFMRIKKEPALRGTILDRNAIPLAVSTPVSSLWVNPKEIAASPESITQLAESIAYPVQRLKDKISQKNESTFMYIQRGLEPAFAKKITDKNIPGVYSLREYRRFYPSADVTSQIIGFNDIDDNGISGLELMYNDWLSGTAGSSKIVRDTGGRVMDILEEIKPPVQGQGLMLTIDKRIQYLTYVALLEATEEFAAKSATAVVLDAKTSEVLAMISVPSGNPNNAQEKKPALVKNRAMTDTFEPGSVMKPLVVATALDAGLVRPGTPIDTRPGRLKVGRYWVKDGHNYGQLDVAGVIKKSSNVGACKIALRLPKEKLQAMYSALGFGQASAINFPGEQAGHLSNMAKLGDFEYCTNSYGYGISATALQVAQAYAVLANDGVKIPATLIKRDSQMPGTRLISAHTAKSVRQMLAQAVNKGGTGTRATLGEYMQDYTVGGKTGTAHKVINGRYSPNHYRSVFVGMAPLSDPRIVMVVMVDDPKGKRYYGGLVAAPVFAKVVGKTLRILGVSPDKAPNPEKVVQVKRPPVN